MSFPFAIRRRDDAAMQSWKEDLLSSDAGPAFAHCASIGHSGNRVSAAGVVAFAIHPLRENKFLRGSGERDWPTHGRTSCSASMRGQPGGSRYSMP